LLLLAGFFSGARKLALYHFDITLNTCQFGGHTLSRFTTTLKTDQTDRRTYKLLDDLVLADEEQRTIIVPAGFVTDFASIQVLHNVFLFVLFAMVAGYGNYAATVHDWLYFGGQVSRKEADAVLYRA
jgi:hypothetical protein